MCGRVRSARAAVHVHGKVGGGVGQGLGGVGEVDVVAAGGVGVTLTTALPGRSVDYRPGKCSRTHVSKRSVERTESHRHSPGARCRYSPACLRAWICR
jgi:hypothetical protein